jgi:hypothetical protein
MSKSPWHKSITDEVKIARDKKEAKERKKKEKQILKEILDEASKLDW